MFGSVEAISGCISNYFLKKFIKIIFFLFLKLTHQNDAKKYIKTNFK